MITSVLLTGIVLALNSFLNTSIKEDARVNLVTGQLLAYRATVEFATSADVLLTSAYEPGNTELRRCLFSNTPTCRITGSKKAVIKLFTPMSAANFRVPVTSGNLADKDGNYTRRGLRSGCGPTKTCPFQSRVQFVAHCAKGASTCTRADEIELFPQIYVHKAKGGKKFVPLSGYPTPLMVKAGIPALRIPVNEILRNAVSECPEGAFMSGIDAIGKPTCKCQNGYKNVTVPLPAGEMPNCKPIAKCPKGYVMAGVRKDGSAFCRKPPDDNYKCENIKTPSNTYLKCPSKDSRMKGVTITDECTIKSNVMHCDFTDITCCERVP
jgi:hypothetical protein